MDTPSLWTQIYSLNPDCVQAFLLRSKKMPLDVKYLLDIDLAAPVLFSESHRFRHVELSSSRAARAFFTHPFPRGAPLLSHLKLSYSSDLRTDSPVCQRGLPALRHLDLRSLQMIDVPLPSGLFNPSLRCLVITKPSQRRSPSAWARILAEFPLLEELTLSFILPRPSSEYLPQVEPESTSPIRLPHLSSLNIIGDNSIDQLSLLQRIVPSNDVRIHFVSHAPIKLYCSIPLDRYKHILDVLRNKFISEKHVETRVYPTHLALRTTLELATATFSNLSVDFSISPDDDLRFYCSKSLVNMSSTPKLLLYLAGLTLALGDLQPAYGMFCSTFSLSKIHSFSLGECISAHQDTAALKAFENLCMQMTNLRVLFIDSTYLSNHLSILFGITNDETEDNDINGVVASPPVLFPILEVLTIQVSDQFWKIDLEQLRFALLSREAAGYAIPRVHLCFFERDVPYITEEIRTIITLLASWSWCSDFCIERDGKHCVMDVKETIFPELMETFG